MSILVFMGFPGNTGNGNSHSRCRPMH